MSYESPYRNFLPPLSSRERDALERDVAEHGVQVPLLVTEDGVLLDGHNRASLDASAPAKVLAGSGAWSDAYRKAFVMGTATKRRNMTPEQWRDFDNLRKSIALELKAEGETQERIATVFGVVQSLVSKWLGGSIINGDNASAPVDCRTKLSDDGKRDVAKRATDGEKHEQIAADYGISRRRVGQISASEKKRRQPPPPESLPDSFEPELYCCSLESLPVEHGSVDAVITDPPYPREYLGVYETLAKMSAQWLRPGGSLVVMCGQSYMPEIMATMVPHIRYQWMIAYVTPGEHTTNIGRRISNIGWKPVIWFLNGDGEQPQHLGFDVVKSDGNDKAHHDWGQSESGMSRLIGSFTMEGDTVADPFLGGGTTAVVSSRMRRRFVGCDIEQSAIDRTRARFEC